MEMDRSMLNGILTIDTPGKIKPQTKDDEVCNRCGGFVEFIHRVRIHV